MLTKIPILLGYYFIINIFRFCHPPDSSDHPRRLIRETMMQYGVVKKCLPLSEWGIRDWWETHYSNMKEALRARETLTLLGIEVTFDNPRYSSSTSQNHTATNSTREVKEIPINETTTFINRPPTFPHPQGPDQLREISTNSSSLPFPEVQDDYKPQSCFKHFLKHPKTVCYLPTLFWHILAIFALIALPVITYMLADMLHLDIYRVRC